jgi:hypothetical protein
LQKASLKDHKSGGEYAFKKEYREKVNGADVAPADRGFARDIRVLF